MERKIPQSLFQRNVEATNRLSIILFCLFNIVAAAYLIEGRMGSLPFQITSTSLVFIFPVVLNRFKYYTGSRILLSYALPLLIYPLSIYNKMDTSDGLLDAVDYFDDRIVLVCSMIIPTSVVSLKERNLFVICTLPSLLGTILFDPIHNLFGVGYYQTGLKSDSYYFTANLFTTISYAFFFSSQVFLKVKFELSEESLSVKGSKLEYYLDKLTEIGNSRNINFGNVQASYEEICLVAKDCLKISRVSIWEYNKKEDSITSNVYLNDNGFSYNKITFKASDYPNYFKAFQNKSLVIATNATNDSDTSEFANTYLKKNNIKSLMDASFVQNGKLGGIICCEHQNIIKEWRAEDSIFLKALADFLSYTHSTRKRIQQNIELSHRNRKTQNTNQILEKKVQKRTFELEERNRQLTEYAFINSHILRAPVARVAGLLNLVELLSEEEFRNTILPKLKVTVKELDDITSQINSAIEVYGSIDRKDFKIKV